MSHDSAGAVPGQERAPWRPERMPHYQGLISSTAKGKARSPMCSPTTSAGYPLASRSRPASVGGFISWISNFSDSRRCSPAISPRRQTPSPESVFWLSPKDTTRRRERHAVGRGRKTPKADQKSSAMRATEGDILRYRQSHPAEGSIRRPARSAVERGD